MSWYVGNTPSVVHDKPLYHGGTRMGLLANREGYGNGTIGGLLGDEVVVTNLNESATGSTNDGTTGWSLRAAATSGNQAWVTFTQGLTAPARSSWPAPYSSAPLSAWNSNQIWIESGNPIDVPANTTIDGRGSQYSLTGKGFRCIGPNVIVHNMTIDFSQWWAANKSNGSPGLYNIWDADMAYSLGPQPFQRAGQCWAPGTTDSVALPGNWQGTWSAGTAYQVGVNWPTSHANPPDGVVYNGIGYVCIQAGTNHQPDTSPTFWTAATGGAVNGALYLNMTGTNIGPYWWDHNTFIGVAAGDGNPVRTAALWDFNDDGTSVGSANHNATISWNHFQDCNKSIILGSNTTDAGDLVSVHHNRFQRGTQRQPLARGGNVVPGLGHFHVYANWYDQPGQLGGGGEVIAVDNSGEVLYEGNLAESSVSQSHAFAFKRAGSATIVTGKTNGNVVLGTMTLANDVGTPTFTPGYSYTLPDLSTSTTQQNFRDLLTSGAGAQ